MVLFHSHVSLWLNLAHPLTTCISSGSHPCFFVKGQILKVRAVTVDTRYSRGKQSQREQVASSDKGDLSPQVTGANSHHSSHLRWGPGITHDKRLRWQVFPLCCSAESTQLKSSLQQPAKVSCWCRLTRKQKVLTTDVLKYLLLVTY